MNNSTLCVAIISNFFRNQAAEVKNNNSDIFGVDDSESVRFIDRKQLGKKLLVIIRL